MTELRKPQITLADVENYKQRILANTVMVSIPVTASILSVSEATVIRRIKAGRLTGYNENPMMVEGAVRVCQGTRILASELQEYVRSIKIDKSLW